MNGRSGNILMNNTQSYSTKIDEALSSLLMAQMLLQRIIPESENEKCRSLAAELVAKLLILAFETLECSSKADSLADLDAINGELMVSSPPGWSFQTLIDSVDVDSQIERHLKSLLRSRWTAGDSPPQGKIPDPN